MSAAGARPLRAVVLDYGLTLVTYRRPDAELRAAYAAIAALLGERLELAAPDAGVLLETVHDRVDAWVAAHEAGEALDELDIAALHRRAYAALGLRVPHEVLDECQRLEQEAWLAGVHAAPDAGAVVGALHDRGLRVGLCSNAPYRPASMHAQLAHVGLAPLLDAAVFSSEIGWRKPSPRIFAAVLERLDADAAEAVMVGDRRVEDIGGARAVGMRTVRTREHADDGEGPEADAVVDRLADLPDVLQGFS